LLKARMQEEMRSENEQVVTAEEKPQRPSQVAEIPNRTLRRAPGSH